MTSATPPNHCGPVAHRQDPRRRDPCAQQRPTSGCRTCRTDSATARGWPHRRAANCPPDKAIHTQHRLGQFSGWDGRQLLQSDKLALPQCSSCERQQAGHRYHRLTYPSSVEFEVNRCATSRADSIASIRPAPISSARDATPITPSAPAAPPTSCPICLSNPMSAAFQSPQRNTTASTRRDPVFRHQQPQRRSETSSDSDDVPGCR